MLDTKKTKDYVDALAKKHNLSKKAVQKLLTYGMKNICQIIKDGEDVQLQHFGSIYFNKQAFKNFLISKSKKNGKNNHGPRSVREGEEFLVKKLASKIHINPKSREDDASG